MKEPTIQLEKPNGLLKFIKEASTTIFALGFLGICGWILNNQTAANTQLAVISVQISNLEKTIQTDRTLLVAEIDALKARVTVLERK